jgi:hypothetical protein
MNPSSFEQLSYHEDINSSHFQNSHSNHLHHKLCLPRFKVNKFDGSDPTGWVTQMENYFSLHGIIDELAEISYSFIYLDPECWKWW